MTATLESLPHIRDVKVLDDDFQASLAKVGEFFAHERLTLTFAVQVGHYHFTRSPNEMLWEEFDAVYRELTTHVVPREQVRAGQPIAWQYTKTGLAAPIIWSGQSLRVATTSPDFQTVLAKVGEFFMRERLTGHMTVRVLRASIPVHPDEAALETTNHMERTQRIVPVLRSTVKAGQASTWRFTRKGRPVVVAWCYEADVEHNGDHDVEDDG